MMRRFSRKNSQNQSFQQFSNPKSKTQTDQPNSFISQPRNKSLKIIQIDDPPIIYSKPAISFFYNLLKTITKNNIQYAFNKLHKKLTKIKQNKLKILHNLTLKQNIKHKIQIINLFKKMMIKNKSIHLFKYSISKIIFKIKKSIIISFILFNKNLFKQSIGELKQIQIKFKENSLPQQSMKQYRKFTKINPKNNKIFIKSIQDSLQQITNYTLQLLQSKRIKKACPSNSQILLSILKTFIQTTKDNQNKITNFQKQLNTLFNQKNTLSNQIKQISKQIDSKSKQLKKFDNDLMLKHDAIIQSTYSAQTFKCMDRIIDLQIKICQQKSKSGYQYTSRLTTLKTASMILKHHLKGSQLSTKTQNQLQAVSKKGQIIQQQTSLQQSDVFQQISKIIDQLLIQIKSQSYPQHLQTNPSDNNFNTLKKNINTPQIISIYQKFQQILKIFINNKQKYSQLQNQNENIKSTILSNTQKLKLQINQLNNKIYIMQQQLKNNQINKIQQIKKLSQENQIIIIQLKKNNQILSTQLNQKSSQFNQLQNQFTNFNTNLKLINNKQSANKQKIKNIISSNLQKMKMNIKSKNKTANSFNYQPKKKQTLPTLQSTNLFSNNKSYHTNKTDKIITQPSLTQKLNRKTPQLTQPQPPSIDLIKTKQFSTQRTNQSKSFPDHLLQPQNLIKLIYNIMIKIKQLPPQSQSAQQILNQLQTISSNSQGIDLLNNLQDYSVLQINHNLKKLQQQSQYTAKIEKLLNSRQNFKTPQTPKRLSRTTARINSTNKTIKNNKFVE